MVVLDYQYRKITTPEDYRYAWIVKRVFSEGFKKFSTQPLSDEDWQIVPFLRLQVYREGHLVYTGTHESQEYFDPVKDYEYRNSDYAHL